jgi:DNA-binding protein H-NS
MEMEIKTNPKRNADYKNAHLMTTEEKRISFMNRYFVFRKARNVNTDKVYKLIVEESVVDKYREKSEEEKEPPIEKKEDTIKTIKKSKAKITITARESVEPEIMKIKVKKSKK